MGTHPIFESDFDCLTDWLLVRSLTVTHLNESLSHFFKRGKMGLDEQGVQKIIKGHVDIKRSMSNVEMTCNSMAKKTESNQNIIIRFVNQLSKEKAEFYS